MPVLDKPAPLSPARARRHFLLRSLALALPAVPGAAALLAPARPAGAATPMTLEGYPVEDSVTVAGSRLTLNGAGVRKRGYFKTELGALYVPQKAANFDDIYQASGPKRIRLVILKDIPQSMASRYFLADFKLSATEEEYNSLLDEVGIMGRVYGNLGKVSKGDVVDVDWVPGVGLMPYLNGRALLATPIRNERFFKVVLRNYIDSGAPLDYRRALLGLTPPNVAER